ncbi:SDR family oxidoreductase [Myxococcota bacterium]|nr:SDR family oxidoreductase [Myxococcota bacterium]
MAKRLEDKVVCITGAGRGLGRALALAFDAEGARLALGARTSPEIDELAQQCHDAIAVQTDVRIAGEVQSLIDATVGEFGRIDVMINNAGLAVYGAVGTYTPNEIEAMLDTNVKGVIHGCQAAFNVMKDQRGGFIINISSIAGKLHLPNESVYCASKWAVTGYTGVLAMEARKHNIRVCNVCPGGIDTPFWATQEVLPFPSHLDPERDFMRPEEVARSVVELVCTSGAYVVSEIVMQPLITT